jgi:hypothetical protein
MISKSLTISVIVLLGITSIFTTPSVSSLNNYNSNVTPKKWTLMGYLSSDAPETGGGAMSTFALYTFSNEYVDVLVLEDNVNDTAKIWYIKSDHTPKLLKDLGEISMGNYTTLRNFIAFCKNNYSSERYILFFYGHGAGWAGALRDHGSGSRDDLTMDEMQKAFNDSGRVDIICFSGPCIMSGIEVAYELKNFADIVIGSETPGWFTPWCGQPISKIFNLLNEQEVHSNSYIGRKIVQYIEENTMNLTDFYFIKAFFSVSAVNTLNIENLTTSISQLAELLMDNKVRNRFKIRYLRSITRSFSSDLPLYGSNHKIRMDLVDIYDFSKKCSKIFFFNKQIRSKSKEVMGNFEDAVIANFKGKLQCNSNGLSIYFPRFEKQYRSSYTSLCLDFINDTSWDEFLHSYFN